MKTAQELRDMLIAVFDHATEEQRRKAEAECPETIDAETLVAHNKVMNNLIALIRSALNMDNIYCTPGDDFYPNIVQLMGYPLYRTYDTYEIAPDVTDNQILAHRAAIEHGDLKALASLRQTPSEKKWLAPMLDAFHERRRMYNNLSYYFYLMALQAKHYHSRSAGHHFLRAASIVNNGLTLLPLNIPEDLVNEMVALALEGAEELMISIDYYNLPEW